jgi:hypothetical protein
MTLVVCESPWSTKGRLERWSVRPFVEGLSESYDARLIYRTFTTGLELQELLSHEAIDGAGNRVIVYIACHGAGGRLSLGRNGDKQPNLASIARYLRRGVECVWLGACDLGRSKSLPAFLTAGGAVWTGGYICSVDWDAGLLLDVAVLQEVLSSGQISTKEGVLRILRRAFTGFRCSWCVGEDSRKKAVILADSIRVIARDRRPGARSVDITNDLRKRLAWEVPRASAG